MQGIDQVFVRNGVQGQRDTTWPKPMYRSRPQSTLIPVQADEGFAPGRESWHGAAEVPVMRPPPRSLDRQ